MDEVKERGYQKLVISKQLECAKRGAFFAVEKNIVHLGGEIRLPLLLVRTIR